MNNKTLILCEGSKDIEFLKEILLKISVSRDKICSFDLSQYTNPQKKGEESIKIRNFLQNSSPYNYLIKAEGGKDGIIGIFPEIRHAIIPITKTIILIDLDRNPYEAIVNKLKIKIKSKNKRSVDLKCTLIKDNILMKLINIEVHIDQQKIHNFYLLCFIDELKHETPEQLKEQIENSEILDIVNLCI